MMDEDNAVVCLKVNGKEIPLNPFVTRVFFNVVAGLVASLDKIPEEKDKIEITIE
jgi:hypothetical protein